MASPRRAGHRAPQLFHQVLIALGAPLRFLADRLSRAVGRGWRGWNRPPDAGVREPRRPRPGPPQDAVMLLEPGD